MMDKVILDEGSMFHPNVGRLHEGTSKNTHSLKSIKSTELFQN
jgi:hypothetical protein